MINSISTWAQGIIIAVILGTILQIIIPNNKNKKYIKVVIGIFVLFCIINPVIGNSFDLEDFDIEKYITLNEKSNNNSIFYEKNVRNMFEEKIKKTIQKQLNDDGYESANIEIITDDDYVIKSIKISGIKESKKKSNISINKIDIGKNNDSKKEINIIDILKIKKKIAELYDIEENKIEVSE
ncbi:MAG: stage III sporulation protein AF [Clostridia bacterium]|nr:stage III sporulation protein AF [Clostridia bacterium]